MSVFSDLFAGGIAGVLDGLGKVALNIRAAITGKTVLESADQIKLLEIATQAEQFQAQIATQLMAAQTAINLAEANSASFWKGGWRPYIGWVCGTALVYDFLLRPILPWIIQVGIGLAGSHYVLPVMPALDMTELMPLLLGMLGLVASRSYDKKQGTN